MKIPKGRVLFLVTLMLVVVMTALLIPAVARCRQHATRTCCCPSNLHQFDLALQDYCKENKSDLYPMALTDLSPDNISAELFICPGDRGALYANSISNAGATASYIYIAGLGPASPGNMPLIICPPVNHEGDGGIVLFCSHETEWFRCSKIDKLIDWTYAYAESNGLRVVVSDALTKRSGGRYKSRP